MPQELLAAEQWLTLSQAAAQLDIHPATLRRWADNGHIAAIITPGGHRRFAASELARFAQERYGRRKATGAEQVWAEQALADTRREVVVHRQDGWLATFDESVRQRHRLLGQRLMGLTLQYLSDENGGVLVDEARKIGRQYGKIGLETGQPLPQILQAALFFRDTLIETALHLPESTRIPPEANARLLRRLNTLLNAVHLAIAETYHAAYTDPLPGT